MSNKLSDMLYPEDKLKNIRLSGNSPCVDCTNMHRYHRGTSIKEEPVDKEKCVGCVKETRYMMDCAAKLRYYEDHDEQTKNLERKDKTLYDRGEKCPETMRDGYMVAYPNGWYHIS